MVFYIGMYNVYVLLADLCKKQGRKIMAAVKYYSSKFGLVTWLHENFPMMSAFAIYIEAKNFLESFEKNNIKS